MKSNIQKHGFTIVEMLTVMGIIAVLIGLLIPDLNQVKDYTKRVQQRVQFHSIDVALEMFKNDFGSYPESNDNSLAPVSTIDPIIYCGANKLAEAMVGWDLLGFHPKSGFTATGINDIDSSVAGTPLIYNPTAGFTDGAYSETDTQNIDSRKKYIELENANALGRYPVTAGPALRRIIDLSTPSLGYSVNPTGQSGYFMSSHYDDQAEMFVQGGKRPTDGPRCN